MPFLAPSVWILLGLYTVSYTHLDVYKRQPYNTDNLPDFDRAATVFGSIDSLATGELTAKDYQSKLADAWVKLSKNKAVTE